MNLPVRAISALMIIAFLTVPSLVMGDELLAPLERSVFPGVTTISYANHTLVFTTADALKIKLQVLPSGIVQLSFKKGPQRGQGTAAPAAGGQTLIFWEEASETVYSGSAPDAWHDVPLGEGGWTEK